MAAIETKQMEQKICGSCQTVHKNEYEYQNHLRGRKHKRRVKAVELETTIPTPVHSMAEPFYMQHTTNLESHLVATDISDIEQNGNEHSGSTNGGPVPCGAAEINIESCPVKDWRQAMLFEALSRPFLYQYAGMVKDTRRVSPQSGKKVKKARRKTSEDGNKGKKVRCVARRKGKISAGAKEEKRRQFHASVSKALASGFLFDRELASLRETVLPPPEQRAETDKLCSDLAQALRQLWEGVTVLQFGSMVTGLAFKGSDLDVTVATTPDLEPSKERKLLAVVAALTGSASFANIVPIPAAKVPIVKCTHLPTGIHCDVSFSNFSAVQNTKLIKFYISLDERVEPMLIVLKYLAKCFNLRPSAKYGLTNYALVVMALFYLMQLDIPILPTVFHLQRNCPPLLTDGWNCGFNPDNYIPKLLPNTSSLPDLLGGFFEFYSCFDFSMYVISPFVGKALPKIAFQNREQLPWEMKSYCPEDKPFGLKIRSFVCVQDPFKLDLNVTSSVTDDTARKIRSLCVCAASVVRSRGPTGLLRQLLRMRPESLDASDDRAEIRIDVGTYLPPVDAHATVWEVQTAWFQLVWKLVIDDIFGRVCKFKMENNCIDKTERFEQATGTDESVLVCKSSGPMLLWERKRVVKMLRETTLQPQMSLIEKEELVSDYMMRQKGPVESAEFECRFRTVRQPTQVILQLVNRAPSLYVFEKWYSFLDGFVNKCYGVIERKSYEK